jgi:hypothetical protein
MKTAPRSGCHLPDAITDPVTGRKISLLDWKAANLRASWLLGFVMVGLLAGLGWLIGVRDRSRTRGVVVLIAVVFAVWARPPGVLGVGHDGALGRRCAPGDAG